MSICVYDNPDTFCRECWDNGELIYAISFDELERKYPFMRPIFFGANVGRVERGRILGDAEAMIKKESK
jgi:hypothetical protein